MWGWLSICVALASASTGCAVAFDGTPDPHEEPNPDPTVPQVAQLAFSSNRGGMHAIYTARADGTNVTRLHPGGQPAWSRDGTKLAFVYAGVIYTMNRDGSNVAPQVPGADPSWSYDGQRLVFTNDDGIVTRAVTNGSGGGAVTLLLAHAFCQVGGEGMCATPRYSADGTMIAFVTANSVNPLRVHVMSSTGTGARALLPVNALWSDSPTWTMDNARIIFTTTDASGTVYIASSKSDGSERVSLVSGYDLSVPAISPDGRAVAFQYSASNGAPPRIWIERDDRLEQLIPNDPTATTAYEDVELVWSPAGT